MQKFVHWYRLGILALSLSFAGTASAQTGTAPAAPAPATPPPAADAAAPAPAEPAPAAPAEENKTEGYIGAEGTKVEIVVEKAIIALGEKNPQEALNLADEALEYKPGEPQLLRIKGMALNEMDRSEEAVNVLLEAGKNDPNYTAHYSPLGTAYLNQKKCDLAVPAFKRAEQADSTDGVAKYGQGICALEKGDHDSAASFFEQSAALGTNKNASEFFRGVALYQKKDNDGAKEAFQKLVARDPDSVHGKEAKEYLKKMGVADEAPAAEKAFTVAPSAAIGWTYDSNVGLTPDGELLPTFLKKKADNRIDLELGLGLSYKASDQFSLGLDLLDVEGAYLNNTDYNQGATLVTPGVTYMMGAKNQEIGGTFEYTYGWFRIGRYTSVKPGPLLVDINNDGDFADVGETGPVDKYGIRYGTFNQSHTASLKLFKRMNELTFNVKGSMSWDMYPNKNLAPGLNNNSRDSRAIGISGGAAYAVSEWSVGTDIGFKTRNARGSEYSFNGFNWTTNAEWLVAKRVALRNATGLSYTVHGASSQAYCELAGGLPNADPCVDTFGNSIDSERREFQLTWSPEVAYKVTKSTEAYFNYTLDWNSASIAAFEYQRHNFGAGARVRWQ